MKVIDTIHAEGHILCHDITRIIKDDIKDTPFRKGHIVTREDIPLLLSLGKEHLYVWEQDETVYHENDAAEILCELCLNKGMSRSEVREGKIDIFSDIDGYFTLNQEALFGLNRMGEIMIATRHGNTPVLKGDKLAGTRAIPLVVKKECMESARSFGADGPILKVLPYEKRKTGIITTGSEVFSGRIQDTFTPVIIEKLKEYQIEVVAHRILGDSQQEITNAILEMIENGIQMVICTGGMSVDPDDRTPAAIRDTGATMVTYGAPVLPGAMFLMAYGPDQIPIMGLPGCVMYAKRTIFDLVLPRVLAGITITPEWIASLGEGGLCLNCPVCTYPNCGFGK